MLSRREVPFVDHAIVQTKSQPSLAVRSGEDLEGVMCSQLVQRRTRKKICKQHAVALSLQALVSTQLKLRRYGDACIVTMAPYGQMRYLHSPRLPCKLTYNPASQIPGIIHVESLFGHKDNQEIYLSFAKSSNSKVAPAASLSSVPRLSITTFT